MITPENNKQDVNIGKLGVEVRTLKEKVDKFIDNEFRHFKDKMERKVDYILWTLILGFLITIALRLF